MKKIKNKEELLRYGDVESRRIVLDILEAVLQRLDSYEVLKTMVSVKDNILRIGTETWELSEGRRIYIIGAGKAVNSMARFFDELLGNRITDGIVIAKIIEPQDVYRHIRLYAGGHPLPNEEGYEASLKVLEMVDGIQEHDLVIGLMSGGCSSLMSCPIEGISLEDEKRTRDVMLKSGANVVEVNAVCRHISRVNGGRLAKKIEEQGAGIICLLIMDALGFPPTEKVKRPVTFGFTQLAPDATTLSDAKEAIARYHVMDELPESVQTFYKECGEAQETPKSLKDWTGFLVNTLPDTGRIVKEEAEKRGIVATVLTNSLTGEAKEAGTFLASLAREMQESGQPVSTPRILAATGEVTTKITGECGLGGPGQELSLGFALAAGDIPGACIASVDTEGTDGPTDLAGGLTDSKTFDMALAQGIDLYQALREHNAFDAVKQLHAGIITGNTGTNLCDLHVLYVPEKGGNVYG